MKLTIILVLLVTLLAVVPALTVLANAPIPGGVIIDQRSDGTNENHFALWDSIAYFAPIGQTFVPSYHQADSNLQKLTGIEVFTQSGEVMLASDFTLTIVMGEPSGTVIDQVQFRIEALTDGWIFVPTPGILLITGQLYTFLISPASGRCAWGLVSNGSNGPSYPQGCWVLNGKEDGNRAWGNDFAFRTYAAVPEQSGLLALGGGLIGLIGIKRKRKGAI